MRVILRACKPRPDLESRSPLRVPTSNLTGKSNYCFVVWSFLLFGLFGCYVFCCLGRWACSFLAVWAGGRVFFFCCLGGVRVLIFAVWAGACFFLLFGRGTGVHSLTGLPGSSSSDPTTKKTKQKKEEKKKNGVQPNVGITGHYCMLEGVPSSQNSVDLNVPLEDSTLHLKKLATP